MRTKRATCRALPFLSLLLPQLLLGVAAPAHGALSVFEVRPGDPNLVLFRSKAPLETIEGTTSAVSGRIEVDLENLSQGDSIRVIVEVDLASIDTGIDLRNRHMRENHLHTDRFPTAVFRAGRIEKKAEGALERGGEARFALAGEFTIHGVTKPLVVPVEVSRSKNDSLTIKTSFDVLLSDFEIPRPEFLIMRLDEKQRVEIRLAAAPEGGEPAEAPDTKEAER